MQDVDEMVSFFSEEIEEVLDRVAPYSERKVVSKRKYKLSQNTLAQMKIRDDMKKACDRAFECKHTNKLACSKCEKSFNDGFKVKCVQIQTHFAL